MPNFVNADRETDFLFPTSMQDWLPEDHLARFVVDVVDQLDLSELTQQYARRGSKTHHPAVLLSPLMKLMKLGQIAVDGSKVNANASKHKALSNLPFSMADIDEWAAMNAEYIKFFDKKPARNALGTAGSIALDARPEIECPGAAPDTDEA